MNINLLISIILFTFFPSQEKKVTVYLIGDSTMAKKELSAYPETGWGMPFAIFFDSTVLIDNRAMNGRSTQSFIDENRWQPVVAKLQEGDFVFIQFGHNDEVPTKATFTNPEKFTANLVKYITETKSKKAIPVLLTPVARRSFDSTGKLTGTHEAYSKLVRSVAWANNTTLIDLDTLSQQLIRQYGVEKSILLFNWLDAGEHPNFPQGTRDNTHFNELGARKMAEIVLASIRKLVPGLAGRIVKR